MGNVSLEIETSLDAPPTFATPEEYSYEKYRSLQGVLDEETYRDAFAQLQEADLTTAKFDPSTLDKLSDLGKRLETAFSLEQIFLYDHLFKQRALSFENQGTRTKLGELCDRELLYEVLKMTGDMDTHNLLQSWRRPAPLESAQYTGPLRTLKPRQEPSPSK